MHKEWIFDYFLDLFNFRYMLTRTPRRMFMWTGHRTGWRPLREEVELHFPGLNPCSTTYLPVGSWVSFLMSWHLSFLIFKMGQQWNQPHRDTGRIKWDNAKKRKKNKQPPPPPHWFQSVYLIWHMLRIKMTTPMYGFRLWEGVWSGATGLAW